ncbi:MAG: diaminopimelate dehydrogenase, partial [Thermodesulfobacteriota bacterium]|nr:diaminopimelate dehydrogenase [Thermodesulfobacteriota bacterium]
MKERIRIGIVGYGNIGRAVEIAVKQNQDMELAGIFTRRNPSDVIPEFDDSKVFAIAEAKNFANDIDVVILCGGSATDLPEQGPLFAALFNTVDSYDTHARIPEYFDDVDEAAKKAGKTSVISTGWDPGLFSMMRVIEEAVLPEGESYTFWGPGVSQGHSDAVRRIDGVKDARQYTIPIESAVDRVRSGKAPQFTTREKHLRDCYVVAEEGADLERIEREIVTMPHYFSDYDTKVTFISEEEMRANHGKMPHGGFVIRTGKDDAGDGHVIEFSLKLGSNPGFTGSVLVAYARAAYRLNKEGETGAKTVFDIAPAYLSIKSTEELRKND